ncbi:MAG: hypothetical protein LLG45_02760 [Actinomycetia bacterium]|nr:hypothetical protein [Actinomycetes bacterium]
MIRIVLIALEILTGLGALGGGVHTLCGARGVSGDPLKGSRFKTHLISGLVLFFVVGGSMLTAAGLLLGGLSVARTVSFEAGVVLVAWVAVQASVIDYRSWLQPAAGALGLAVMVLSFLLPSPG